jgi:hypothetical protein
MTCRNRKAQMHPRDGGIGAIRMMTIANLARL